MELSAKAITERIQKESIDSIVSRASFIKVDFGLTDQQFLRISEEMAYVVRDVLNELMAIINEAGFYE